MTGCWPVCSGEKVPSSGGSAVSPGRESKVVNGESRVASHSRLSSCPTAGSLNLLVRSRNKGAGHAWSLSGNKGNVWQQAHVPINLTGPSR